ncbi:hypothetical protein C8R46DRAFT_1206950 [Mycena filopes]|nr:hypothetical protein C8R46DRAFT_1206950 [Mycena filopes]
MAAMNRIPVNPDNEFSLEWVGVNKTCLAIPDGAPDRIDDHHYQEASCPVDEYGRYRSIEWADQPDWYRSNTHWRCFIPLERSGDLRRGAWAKQTKSRLPVDLLSNGKWALTELTAESVEADITLFREYLEEVCSSDLYDEETEAPALFDVDRVGAQYDTELDVHSMVMDARRAVLDTLGFIAWWTSAVPNWINGLTGPMVDKILGLGLHADEKRGMLISVNRDWKELNFPLLFEKNIPFFYVWGLFEEREARFLRLDPGMLREYLDAVESNQIIDVWSDDIPRTTREFNTAARYDRFFQLKLDPHSHVQHELPLASETSGEIEYWVIDFQHWSRRRLAEDERVDELNKLYHHIAVQSESKRVTRVIFHRFHKRPPHDALYEDDVLMDKVVEEQDPSVIRERFKGRCAPRYGECYDSETGVERRKAVTDADPAEVVARIEVETLLLPSAGALQEPGWHLRASLPPADDYKHDATRYGRGVGPRVTSPSSDHSSERRPYDSSQPMAYAVGWVAAMARDQWSDTRDHYVSNRNGRRAETRSRGGSNASGFDDARSYFSISSADDRSRRSESPERRGHIQYPIRSRTPPPFRRQIRQGETKDELAERREGWLNNFADWGRRATFNVSVWRVPPQFSWHPDVLEHGYLLIDAEAEFRLRYQVVVNPAIRYSRHVLEVAMERGIAFTIAFKKADADRFKPRPEDEETTRAVTKAMVDLRASGPILESSSSMPAVYRQYRSNFGLLGTTPQARALVMKGGGASWLIRAYIGLSAVRRAMSGPSAQVTVHHAGANDSGDDNSLDVFWDDVSDGDLGAVFGLIRGSTRDQDTYLFPTDAILEEASNHHLREWNPFCDKTFRHLKDELDQGRGLSRTRRDWIHYFQSSNRGTFAPTFVATKDFCQEGIECMRGAFGYKTWNKSRVKDLALDIPPQFLMNF